MKSREQILARYWEKKRELETIERLPANREIINTRQVICGTLDWVLEDNMENMKFAGRVMLHKKGMIKGRTARRRGDENLVGLRQKIKCFFGKHEWKLDYNDAEGYQWYYRFCKHCNRAIRIWGILLPNHVNCRCSFSQLPRVRNIRHQ